MPHVIAPADLYIAPLGVHVTAGETVEVDEETARSLCALGWKSPEATPARPARSKAPAGTE